MTLQPGHVGQRVVVRRLLPGLQGPSGGPAMTDVLGVLESWEAGQIEVRREDGGLVSIALADIVAAKPVPPRASVRQRISADRLEAIANEGWPAPEQQPLGHWLLRAAGGFTQRANSALTSDDDADIDAIVSDRLSRVAEFYADRASTPVVQVVVGSKTHLAVERHGWLPARPGEADTCFQVASVAQATRRTRERLVSRPLEMPLVIESRASMEWLGLYGNAAATPDLARAVLEAPDTVGFAMLGDPAVGIGRVVVTGDWAGIAAVEVVPEHRRRALGLHLMAALLDWAAERGATSVYLQTRGENTAALSLYESLGFATHHEYRYLRSPEPGVSASHR